MAYRSFTLFPTTNPMARLLPPSERVDGAMKETGEYAGVVLDGIDPVKLAEGVGIEGMHVQEESRLAAAIEHGLNVVEREKRPFLLDIRLPLGLPEGGRAAAQFRLADAMSPVQIRAA